MPKTNEAASPGYQRRLSAAAAGFIGNAWTGTADWGDKVTDPALWPAARDGARDLLPILIYCPSSFIAPILMALTGAPRCSPAPARTLWAHRRSPA